MKTIFIRTEYNYDMDKASLASALECKDDSLAIQSQRDEADINTIVKRFGITGTLPQTLKLPEYADYEEVFDYRSALDAVKEAERQFMSIPADIRAKFDNDPGQFLEFVSDPVNIEAVREMGLASKKPESVVPVADLPA